MFEIVTILNSDLGVSLTHEIAMRSFKFIHIHRYTEWQCVLNTAFDDFKMKLYLEEINTYTYESLSIRMHTLFKKHPSCNLKANHLFFSYKRSRLLFRWCSSK